MIIYDTIYNLIVQYIFGTVTSGTYQELVCILFSVGISLLVMCLPFIVVELIIKMLFDVWTNFICGGR